MPSSSSTTRMVAMNSQCARDVAATAARRGDGGPSAASLENDSETCAPARAVRRRAAGAVGRRAEVGDADARAVLVGDLLHHRQAEAGALVLGRDVGLERALEHLLARSRGRCRCTSRRTARTSPLLVARRLGDDAHPAVGPARPPRRARSAPGCGSPGAAGSPSPTIGGSPARAARRAGGPPPAPCRTGRAPRRPAR